MCCVLAEIWTGRRMSEPTVSTDVISLPKWNIGQGIPKWTCPGKFVKNCHVLKRSLASLRTETYGLSHKR